MVDFVEDLVAPVVGGLFGMEGQRQSAREMRKMARENREWQERMSNSAYGRAMHDLRDSGLNPILAAQNPATTPGGSVAQVPDYSKAAQMATDVFSAVSQSRVNEAQVELLGTQAELNTGLWGKSQAEIRKIFQETQLTIANQANAKAQLSNIFAEYDLMKEQTELTRANAWVEKAMVSTLEELGDDNAVGTVIKIMQLLRGK